jgi:ribonuclease E
VLALLMMATCWVVSSSLSVWLVPPYLILMALILFGPSARSSQGDRGAAGEPESHADLDPASPDRTGWETEPPSGDSDPASPSELDNGPLAGPAKARRGKGRKRATRPAVEPTGATWIEVAPGKFVRVELSQTSAEAGPHESSRIPDDATPRHPEPPPQPDLEAEGPAEVDATLEEAPATEADHEPNPDASPESEPAVDGSTPQVEFALATTEAEPLCEAPEPEAVPEANPVVLENADGWDSGDDGDEPISDFAAEAEFAEDEEPPSPPFDPIEPSDSDDTTDAQPSSFDLPPEATASRGSRRSGAFPSPIANESTHGRLVRSSRSLRKPGQSRRPSRRRLARPRQISRNGRPRSPPRPGRPGRGISGGTHGSDLSSPEP